MIDLRVTPLSINVIPEPEHSRERENELLVIVAQRDRNNPLSISGDDNDMTLVAAHTDLMSSAYFFHSITWPEAHEKLKIEFAGRIDELRENPQLGIDFLETVKEDHFRQYLEERLRIRALDDPDMDEEMIQAVIDQLLDEGKIGIYITPNKTEYEEYEEKNKEKNDHGEL